MPSVEIFNQKKEKVGSVNLSDVVFGTKVNKALVHQVLKAQMAAERQGTAKTKTKGEVRGGGRKPFKQKGTGNARQGSSRSPLNPGGGQNFGPQPRNYAENTPKEMSRGALRSALSDRLAAKHLLVLDQFNFTKPATSMAAEVLNEKFGIQNALIVTPENKNFELSARNLKGIKVVRTEAINLYDIIKHDWLILTQDAAKAIDAQLGE